LSHQLFSRIGSHLINHLARVENENQFLVYFREIPPLSRTDPATQCVAPGYRHFVTVKAGWRGRKRFPLALPRV
jgi:hypothetical protein